jgi:transposase
VSFAHRFSEVNERRESKVREIGLDVHRDFCEVAICEAGEVRSAGRIKTNPEELELFAQSLGAEDRVALEVTGNAWEVARIIRPHVARVLVVSPNDTGIRQARAKTDRLDARTIAKLLAAGSLEGLWMPDGPTRAMRRRLQRRRQLVRARTRAKNEVHAALMRRLIAKPTVSDLFGVEGRRRLEALELPVEERETVDSCLRQIDFLESELVEADRVIATDALSSPEVRRLMSVPGVNVITAATFMAAVGEIGRFATRRRLVGYLGLDPRVRQSGSGPAAHGRISKQGSAAARYALVEATWSVGPPAGAASRLLPAGGGPARPPGGDRRHRAQARLPVLVPAHPRGGLRLRAALVDEEEAAPAGARRRSAEGQGGAGALGREQGDARGRTRAGAPGRGGL